jgi:hypothetical protein
VKVEQVVVLIVAVDNDTLFPNMESCICLLLPITSGVNR